MFSWFSRGLQGCHCRSVWHAMVRGVVLGVLLGGGLAQAQDPVQSQPSSITVVLDDDYPPYIFRDDKGEIQGILKDSWALWQEHTGVIVKLQPLPWADALAAMQSGQADVIDTVFKTPQREQQYDFSAPYDSIEVPIFFHNSVSGIVNAESLKGFTVGVKSGDACIDYLASHGVEHFKRFPSYSAVLGAAKAGNVRVFCMDQPPGVYLLHKMGMTQDYLHSKALSTGQLHRAVHKGNSALLALVERGFASLTPEQVRQLEEKWYGAKVHEIGNPSLRRSLRYGVLGLTVVAATLILWNLMLRRRVRDKTRDLTHTLEELRQVHQSSDQALQRLNGIANQIPGLVYQYLLRPDGSSCFPYASEAIHDVYRCSPEQVRRDASCVFSLLHPDDVQGVIDSIQTSARDLTPWKCEYRTRHADGTVHWLFGDALPQRLDDGSVLWHGVITDITERKLSDEKLRQLSQAVEQAPIAMVITDLDGNIEYANPSFCRISGYTLDEVRGTNPRILQSGQTPPALYVEMWATLLAGKVWHGELHNRAKDGNVFVEEAVISPVLNAQGVATHYVAMKQDMTARKQADDLLNKSLQEKTALLHEVHHRVKNNLQVITSLLRLEAGRSDNRQTQTVLKDMQGRIHAMALLHETLYRGGNFAGIDLASYLKQLATQTFRTQSGADNAVQLLLDITPAKVTLDQATPCGLLVNELLSNALKHAFPERRSGSVTLQLRQLESPDIWCVSVQDNGIGLPADFEQRRTQSLGLQLVSDLARQLGGTLQAATLATGGARFSVTFALHGAYAQAAL